MTITNSPYKTRDSFEVVKIRRMREAERAVNKEIDDKVNQAVKRYLAEGQPGIWCVVS